MAVDLEMRVEPPFDQAAGVRGFDPRLGEVRQDGKQGAVDERDGVANVFEARIAGERLQLSAEFGDADLGDIRLKRRLGRLADSVGSRPGESFPKALDDAELEAAYRFFGNAQVSPEAIFAPHVRQSARRAAELPRVLVVHDTTTFEFGGRSKREGLGHLIKPSAQGFFGHFSLAIGADGQRRPVGLLALETVFRLKKTIGHKHWTKGQR